MDTSGELEAYNSLDAVPKELIRIAKQQGFSDFQIGRAVLKDMFP